jgi:hypothetical protein
MRHRILATVAFVVGASSDADAQVTIRRVIRDEQVQRNAFEWSGELASGNRLVLRSLNGNIRVERSTGRNLEVVADKKWRRGTPANVTIEVTRINGGRDVLVCARWTPQTECTETEYSMHSRGSGNNNNDTQVEFTIKLPAGADATLNTTNGGIEVLAVSGAINAHTTNGSVAVESTGGPVEAHTTNGDIDVRMAKLPPRGTTYGTTNGSITIAIPDGTDANIEARTTFGRIHSDFEMRVSGDLSSRRLSGTIGRGGPLIRLATTNGSVRIEKR